MPKDDESLEAIEHRELLGQRASRVFWRYMDREYFSKRDIRYIRDTYCVDEGIHHKITEMIQKADGEDLGADEKWVEAFREMMGRQWMEARKKSDPLTQVSIMATASDHGWPEWPMFDERLWIGWIAPGRYGYVRGLQGTGKTDFLCKLAEIFLRHGGHVVSSIPLSGDAKPPPEIAAMLERYHYCKFGSELIKTSCMLMNQGIHHLVLGDEAFLFASGETPMATAAMKFRKMFRLYRKMGIAYLAAAQFTTDILKDIRREAVIRVRKSSKVEKDRAYIQMDYSEVAGYKFHHGFADNVRSIPPTTLPFDTNAIKTFEMDFEPDQLLNYLNSLDPNVNQYEATIGWFKERGFIVSNEYKKWFVKKFGRPQGEGEKRLVKGVDLARLLEVSPQSISAWLNEPD